MMEIQQIWGYKYDRLLYFTGSIPCVNWFIDSWCNEEITIQGSLRKHWFISISKYRSPPFFKYMQYWVYSRSNLSLDFILFRSLWKCSCEILHATADQPTGSFDSYYSLDPCLDLFTIPLGVCDLWMCLTKCLRDEHGGRSGLRQSRIRRWDRRQCFA